MSRLLRASHLGRPASWFTTANHQVYFPIADPLVSSSTAGTPIPSCELSFTNIPLFPHPLPAVYAIGLNYSEHIAETRMDKPKFPVVFTKTPTSTISSPQAPIIIPKCVSPDEVDFEAELAIVLKKTCKDLAPEQVPEHILGYTCANDVTARKWQGKRGGGQWTRSKSFDTFNPLGPCIRLHDGSFDPMKTDISSHLCKRNGSFVPMQASNTSHLIFGVNELVSFLSQDTTLLPWTVILTGTPSGVGYTRQPPVYLEPGDVVRIEIAGIGVLENPVIAASS